MTTPASQEPVSSQAPAALVERERGFSWTWILPVAALAFAVYLIVATWGARGPLITVHVREGHGIQVGDPLRYRGVQVGEIEVVQLENDLSGVSLAVRLEPAAEALAREGSRFWLVRPQLSLEGVQGLETILGANYLAVLPALSEGDPREEFVALDEPPIRDELEAGGLRIVLDAPRRFGLGPGAMISFRDFQVGTVVSVALSSDATSVEVEAYIRADYVDLVRENTRFWEVGGVEVEFAFTVGLRIDVGSLHSMLVGGVAMATPEDPGRPARSGERFELHAAAEEDWLEWQPALSVGAGAPEAGSKPPRPLRAELSWKADRILSRTHDRSGLLLPVPGGLIGPADMLRPVDGAGENTQLSVEGEEHPLLAEPFLAGGLARVDLALPAVDPWAIERVDWGAQAGDWTVFSDPGQASVPISAARAAVIDDGWEISGEPVFAASWHGAPVIDRASGKLVGIMVVDEDHTRVLRVPAALWSEPASR